MIIYYVHYIIYIVCYYLLLIPSLFVLAVHFCIQGMLVKFRFSCGLPISNLVVTSYRCYEETNRKETIYFSRILFFRMVLMEAHANAGDLVGAERCFREMEQKGGAGIWAAKCVKNGCTKHFSWECSGMSHLQNWELRQKGLTWSDLDLLIRELTINNEASPWF